MDKTVTMTCNLCLHKREVRHIDLYVWGSEGLWACHECEMLLVGICTDLARMAYRVRKAEHDAQHSVAKQTNDSIKKRRKT